MCLSKRAKFWNPCLRFPRAQPIREGAPTSSPTIGDRAEGHRALGVGTTYRPCCITPSPVLQSPSRSTQVFIRFSFPIGNPRVFHPTPIITRYSRHGSSNSTPRRHDMCNPTLPVTMTITKPDPRKEKRHLTPLQKSMPASPEASEIQLWLTHVAGQSTRGRRNNHYSGYLAGRPSTRYDTTLPSITGSEKERWKFAANAHPPENAMRHDPMHVCRRLEPKLELKLELKEVEIGVDGRPRGSRQRVDRPDIMS